MHNLWWKIVHVRVWHLDDYDPPGDDGSLQVELCHFARPLLAFLLAQERHLGVDQVTGFTRLCHASLNKVSHRISLV